MSTSPVPPHSSTARLVPVLGLGGRETVAGPFPLPGLRGTGADVGPDLGITMTCPHEHLARLPAISSLTLNVFLQPGHWTSSGMAVSPLKKVSGSCREPSWWHGEGKRCGFFASGQNPF